MKDVVERSASQQAAIVSSQSVANLAKELSMDKKSDDSKSKNSIAEDPISYIIASDDDTGSRTEILKGLFSKINRAGLSLGKSKEQIMDEKSEESESASDMVKISSSYKRGAKKSSGSFFLNLEQAKDLTPRQKNLIEQYASSYYSYLQSEDPKLSKKIKGLESELKDAGISDSKLFSVQKDIRTAVRTQIAAKMKENFLVRDFSSSKMEEVLGKAFSRNFADGILSNSKLGGWDFGGYNDSLQGTIDRGNDENRSDVSAFILQEIEEKLTNKMANKSQDTRDLSKLIELASLLGVDLESWLGEVWMKRREDLGLIVMDLPKGKEGNVVDFNANESGQGKGGGNNGKYELDEVEDLTSKLRAVYMRRLIKGDVFTHIGTMFEIRKCKSGLFKLGVYSKELDEKIAFEAEVLARKKVLDMINEAVVERSTLYVLKGSAYEANNKKIKTLIATADRLGMNIDEQDIKELQNKSDSAIIQIVESQISDIERQLNKKRTKIAEKTLSKLMALKDRLSKDMKSAEAEGSTFSDSGLL